MMTGTRRLLALLLAAGVVAASSGLAIHDPDCPHHAESAPYDSPQSADHDGHDGHAVHLGYEGHAGADGSHEPCECAGFCALAGAVDPAHPAPGASVAVSNAPVHAGLGLSADTCCRVAHRVAQPPATGPPSVA
jgi:hypothetical protein